MRLLYISTLELQENYGETIPRYAILSDTWGDEGVFSTAAGIEIE